MSSHVEGAQKGASEQILVVTCISPTLNVAHTGAVIQFLDEESLVYLPILTSYDSREGKLGATGDNVDS